MCFPFSIHARAEQSKAKQRWWGVDIRKEREHPKKIIDSVHGGSEISLHSEDGRLG